MLNFTQVSAFFYIRDSDKKIESELLRDTMIKIGKQI